MKILISALQLHPVQFYEALSIINYVAKEIALQCIMLSLAVEVNGLKGRRAFTNLCICEQQFSKEGGGT